MIALRTALLAGACLAPWVAGAQTPGHYEFKGQIPSAQLNKDFGSKVDAVTAEGSVTIRLGQALPLYNEGIPGVASTYFGLPAQSTRDVQAYMPGGHERISGCYTRGWNATTGCLIINANTDPRRLGGGQGLYWDYNYRRAYDGQDGSILNIFGQGIVPVARSVAVSSFSTIGARDLAGNPVTVYATTLSTPLTPSQIAAMLPLMRVETNNKFFGYTIPDGVTTPGGAALPQVSADGRTIYTDNWTRGAPGDAEGPGVLPSSYGQGPSDPPLGSYTVSIDVLHLLETTGRTLRFDDNDMITNGYIEEDTIINNHTAEPTVNIDVLGESPLFLRRLAGCQSDNGVSAGVCSGGDVMTGPYRRAFVARNSRGAGSQATIGFLSSVAGPDFGFMSQNTTGYAYYVSPNGVGDKFHVEAVTGDTFVGGNLSVAGPTTLAGPVVLQAGAGYPLALQQPGQPATLVADRDGNLATTGNITAGGRLTVAQKTPASSTAPCSVGEIVDDANYHYACVAANTWKRAALSSF